MRDGDTKDDGGLTKSFAKFSDLEITATGERRAAVPFTGFDTLWFNTGTLCNLTCQNCYIDSSPQNDRLIFLTRAEVRRFIDEGRRRPHPPVEIGFTGGEPFINPDFLGMVEDCLAQDFRVLVLTNAMRPMQRLKEPLLDLERRFPRRMTMRISLDHYTAVGHECLRGSNSWRPAIDGLEWLMRNGFEVAVAGRTVWSESADALRSGYRALFTELSLPLDVDAPGALVLFPEMEAEEDVPEITERCWSILGKAPESVMCANSRMVVKRHGAPGPVVVSCTLLPYEIGFEMGETLSEASGPVKLNHSHCARFCVLGGASCG